MRIYVDMDDVLCQTVRTLIDVLDERFGRRVEIEEMEHFELSRSFRLSHEEWRELMRIAHQPSWLESMLPVAGAQDALRHWTHSGCEVSVVTGRPPSAADPSRRWLETHAMPHVSLDFVDKYGRDWEEGASPRAPRALSLDELREMSFDFAVEDSHDMAVFLAEELGIPVALIDQPWNRRPIPEAPAERIVRCSSWRDVIESAP